MDINKILEGSLDEIADNIFNETKNTTDKAKAIQKQRIGENVQYVIDALKKIEADLRGDLRDEYRDVANKLSERITSIKDGKDGRNGADGRAGKDGRAGRDGLAGSKGADGLPGRDGIDGVDGVSVTDASIDFDGSLIISLSNGRVINVGEVVSQDLADKIQVISTMSTNGAVGIQDEGTSISTGVKNINFVGASVTSTASGDNVTVNIGAAGTGVFDAGTALLPSITTTGDLNTGVYFPAADTVGITTGGAQRGEFSSTGLAVTGALSATGNTTLGDATTDTVTVNGYMAVGGAVTSGVGLYVRNSALTGANQFGAAIEPTVTSAATNNAVAVSTQVSLAASAFTALSVVGYDALNAAALSGGAAITNLYGLRVQDQTRGTNNYGVTSQVSSGANKYNIYASGTAQNAFAGNVRIGSVVAPTVALDVTGAALISTTLGVTGVSTFAAGTVALPSITTSGDTNTGVYFPAADTVGITNAGVEAMRLDSSGNVLVNQTASYSGYIATSSGWFPRIQVSNVGVGGDIGVGIYSWSTYTGDLGGGIGNGGELILAHSNVNTRGAHTAISDNMVCGRITFNGSNGTAFAPGAYISVAADGQTWAVNDCPARIVFGTTADGAGTPTERMRISSSGNVGIGATANASAILDAQSTTKGVRMPNMTTTQKNAIASPAAGLMVYDTTLAKLCVYTTAWETITSV